LSASLPANRATIRESAIRLASEHDDGGIELVERLSREDTRIVAPVLAAITLAATVIALALQTYFGRLPFWC
jgi:hypothetical protein